MLCTIVSHAVLVSLAAKRRRRLEASSVDGHSEGAEHVTHLPPRAIMIYEEASKVTEDEAVVTDQPPVKIEEDEKGNIDVEAQDVTSDEGVEPSSHEMPCKKKKKKNKVLFLQFFR
jgi:hypothetical protein